MTTLNIQNLDADTLKQLAMLASRCYSYCTRQCGKWGSPSCFNCMFRDIRKLHQKLSDKRKEGDYHG